MSLIAETTTGHTASRAPLAPVALTTDDTDRPPVAEPGSRGGVQQLASLLSSAAIALPDDLDRGCEGLDGPGFDACTALVCDDDPASRTEVGAALARAGAEIVLDTTAPPERLEAVVAAGMAAAPAVVVLGDIAGCSLDRIVSQLAQRSPDTAIVVYRAVRPEEPVSAQLRWVPKPDLEALELELRRHTGTADW